MKGNMMKVKNSQFMVAMLALSLAAVTGYAQTSQPSSKVTAKTANLTLLPETSGTGNWQTLLSNTIKTSNQKDLFINASFEVGLFTQTKVTSKNMTTDTSTATANVQVRVLVDGRVFKPGPGPRSALLAKAASPLSPFGSLKTRTCLSTFHSVPKKGWGRGDGSLLS